MRKSGEGTKGIGDVEGLMDYGTDRGYALVFRLRVDPCRL
jgi:hypothetical protein